MQTKCLCPTCGHPVDTGAVPIESLVDASNGAEGSRIIGLLIDAYPRHVQTQRIANLVYCDDPNGGPDFAVETIRVIVHRLRKTLPRYGWTIPIGKRGAGSQGYRLAPIEGVSA